MPRISSFFGIVIYMYFKDHNPPHFHAVYGDFSAEISIKDFALIEGKLPPRAMSLVIEWAAQHQKRQAGAVLQGAQGARLGAPLGQRLGWQGG